MHLITVLYNHFFYTHKKRVCFTSVNLNFTDLIVFVDLGTGLHKTVYA